MREVLLSGSLARKYGRRFHFDVSSPAEAVSALMANFKGFESDLNESESRGVRYAIFVGRANVCVDELALSGKAPIRIVPVLRGSKRGGILQIIVGAVLVVAGLVLMAYGQEWGIELVKVGGALILGGIVQLLTPIPRSASNDSGNNSKLFSGAENVTLQGVPVPILLGGPLKVGSVVIGVGLDADQINVSAPLGNLTCTISSRTVNYDASGSTPTSGNLATFVFDFGDGSNAIQAAGSGTPLSGSLITHTYAAAGTYTATLICTNSNGYASDPVSLTITVS